MPDKPTQEAVELPEGVERYTARPGHEPSVRSDGDYIAISDLPAIIAANRDRALLELVDRWAEAGGERDKLCPPIRETVDAILAREREKLALELEDDDFRAGFVFKAIEEARKKAEAERDQAQEALERERNRRAGRISENRDQIKAQALVELREKLTDKSFVEETIDGGKAFIADLECLFDALPTLDRGDQEDPEAEHSRLHRAEQALAAAKRAGWPKQTNTATRKALGEVRAALDREGEGSG